MCVGLFGEKLRGELKSDLDEIRAELRYGGGGASSSASTSAAAAASEEPQQQPQQSQHGISNSVAEAV